MADLIQQQNPPKTADRTIDRFKSRLSGGIARPNLFEVVLTFPDDVVDASVNDLDSKSRFLVKGANLPASNITPITIPFRGRNLKIAGDRTFDVWTITVINDTDFAIRNAMETWMNGMNNLQNATGETTPNDYQTDAYVYQLGRNGIAAANSTQGTAQLDGPKNGDKVPVLKAYKFHGIFPTNISAIELSYDQPDTIEEFTVDLQVQWWDAIQPDGNSLFAETR